MAILLFSYLHFTFFNFTFHESILFSLHFFVTNSGHLLDIILFVSVLIYHFLI